MPTTFLVFLILVCLIITGIDMCDKKLSGVTKCLIAFVFIVVAFWAISIMGHTAAIGYLMTK